MIKIYKILEMQNPQIYIDIVKKKPKSLILINIYKAIKTNINSVINPESKTVLMLKQKNELFRIIRNTISIKGIIIIGKMLFISK